MIIDLGIEGPRGRIEFMMDLDPQHQSCVDLSWFLEKKAVPEPELIELMLRALKPGDVAVDGGANIGFFTLIMSRLVGPTGHVHAVEPDERNLALLRRNLVLNNILNVTLVSGVLGAADGFGDFFAYSDTGAGSTVPSSAQDVSAQVPMWSIDTLVHDSAPRFIKLDLEGGEPAALLGAKEVLGRGGRLYVVVELNPECLARAGMPAATLRHSLAFYGYDPYILHADGSLPALVPPGTLLRPVRANGNVLFARPGIIERAWPEVIV